MTAPTGPQTPAADHLPADGPPGSADGVRAVVDLHAETLSVGTVERPYRRVVVRREVVVEEVSVVVTVRREVLRVEHEDLVDDVPAPFVLRSSEELAADLDASAQDAVGELPEGAPPVDASAVRGRADRTPPRSFEVVLHEERPVVGVEVVPVERVVVRTVRHEALGVVRADVRHEEVELQRSTAAGPSWSTPAE